MSVQLTPPSGGSSRLASLANESYKEQVRLLTRWESEGTIAAARAAVGTSPDARSLSRSPARRFSRIAADIDGKVKAAGFAKSGGASWVRVRIGDGDATSPLDARGGAGGGVAGRSSVFDEPSKSASPPPPKKLSVRDRVEQQLDTFRNVRQWQRG
jgi:hypothetical protein